MPPLPYAIRIASLLTTGDPRCAPLLHDDVDLDEVAITLQRLMRAVGKLQAQRVLTRRQRVLVVGVVYEGRCIPLAWRVYRANSAADYPAEGQARMIIRLLKQVRAGLPAGTRVRVLADRGLAPRRCCAALPPWAGRFWCV